MLTSPADVGGGQAQQVGPLASASGRACARVPLATGALPLASVVNVLEPSGAICKVQESRLRVADRADDAGQRSSAWRHSSCELSDTTGRGRVVRVADLEDGAVLADQAVAVGGGGADGEPARALRRVGGPALAVERQRLAADLAASGR